MIIFIKNYSKNKNKMTFNQTNAPAIVATTNNDVHINVNTVVTVDTTATAVDNNTIYYPRMFDRWKLPL